MRDSFSLLDELESDLETLTTRALDDKYREFAIDTVGSEVAEAIARLPTTTDGRALERGLLDALDRCARAGAVVVNIEYDLHHQWAVWFFVCHDYSAPEEGDDSWAGEYAEEVRGPTLDDLASLHHAHGAFDDSSRFGATLYLIARFCLTLRDLVRAAPHPHLGVSVGYHKQDPIWRLREPELR
jgi:hypothetical protein